MPPFKSVESPLSDAGVVGSAEPAGLLKSLAWTLTYVGCLVVVGVLMLAATLLLGPLVAVTAPGKRKSRARSVIQQVFRFFMWLFQSTGMVNSRFDELDRLSATEPVIVIANHPCLLDAVFLVSRLPNAVCIMKASLSWNPLLGLGAKLAGYIPNSSSHGLVRGAVQSLNDGGQLVIFPEGTRTRGKPMAEMKAAFATIARRAEVPVVPVVIESDSRFLSKGWPLWRTPAFPITYRFRVGRPLEPTLSREQMLTRVEDFYQRELPGSGKFDLQSAPDRATQGQV